MNLNNRGLNGKVYLIGAGPGDVGLLTLKGAEYLSSADVIVYDYLSSNSLLSMSKDDSEHIYVGKKASDHTLTQEVINNLLVEKAREGKYVARLKGGDPYVFGRGGEEALALSDAGIEFEVVPGVTAGIAAAAYAGIPFTHRGITSTAGFITGHEMDGKNESSIDWESIAGLGTLVFYMGVRNLPVIVSNLKKEGRSGTTPAAIVQWGTLTSQRSAEGTLDTIVDVVRQKKISTPALIVIGDVVNLRSKLNWFEKKPLFGKKIIVTRSRAQASSLSKELRELGAEVIEFPTIEISLIPDNSNLDRAIDSVSDYSWIIFTSVNSVEIFFKRVMSIKDARILAGIKIAVIGSATAMSLNEYGIKADIIPEQFTSEGIVKALESYKAELKGKKVLIPGSLIARDLLPVSLTAMGALVEAVPVYENKTPEYTAEYIDSIFDKNLYLCTFTSSSTVTNFIDILKVNNRNKYISKINGASIGPVTSKTAKEAGINLSIEAGVHTIPSLVSEIVNKAIKKENK
jgi:uroporphyrinogen III methyltransferase/synthase